MNLRTAHNPYGSPTMLVDKMIGNAYEIVRYVARHLKVIKYVAANMDIIQAAADGEPLNETVVLATAGGLGQTVLVPLPEGVDVDRIIDYSVLIKGTNDALYSPDNDVFSSRIQNGSLRVTLSQNGNTYLVGGQIRWLIKQRL